MSGEIRPGKESRRAEYETVRHELPPVWSEEAETLILGSIPSPKSRETGFYYGHPRNRFWRVIAAASGERPPESVEEKKALILKNRLALWDVLSSCEIRGADDASIREPVPNDIAGLIKKTKIKRIFTTGGKADKLYMKYVYPSTGIISERLPSTSPANCAVSEERLTEIYKRSIFGE